MVQRVGTKETKKRKPSYNAELNHLNDGDREIKRSPNLLIGQNNTAENVIKLPSIEIYNLQDLSVCFNASAFKSQLAPHLPHETLVDAIIEVPI